MVLKCLARALSHRILTAYGSSTTTVPQHLKHQSPEHGAAPIATVQNPQHAQHTPEQGARGHIHGCVGRGGREGRLSDRRCGYRGRRARGPRGFMHMMAAYMPPVPPSFIAGAPEVSASIILPSSSCSIWSCLQIADKQDRFAHLSLSPIYAP